MTICGRRLATEVYPRTLVAGTVAMLSCVAPAVAAAQAGGAATEQGPTVGGGDDGIGGPASGIGPDVDGPLTLEGAPVAPGQASVSVGILAGRPTVSAIRTDDPPRIDGALDDPAWRTSAHITDFVQQRPVEGAPATERTEVFVSYDSENIYLGIYAHYSDPKLIRASRVDRDQTGRDDTVQFFFDPFLDQQRAYVLSVNAYGVQSDSVLDAGSFGGPGGGSGGGFDQRPGGHLGRNRAPGGSPWDAVVDGRGSYLPVGNGTSIDLRGADGVWERLLKSGPPQNHSSGGARSGAPGNSSWDALFESAGRMVDNGWTAEMAIPFKSLRYPRRQPGEVHRWGFQIARTIDSKDENVVWAPVSRNVMGILRQMGVVEGMTDLSRSRNLEFLPTMTAIGAGALDATTGVYDTLDTQPEAGLNVKYGVTSDLVLDFTYNPDFSQIESDRPQIEVNQRFPVFYPELRPFFLEGQEIYQISAPDRLSVVDTRTVVNPRFGAKLTGKIGNTAVGFLVADDEAAGRVDDRTDIAYGRSARVLVGRVRYDLYSESHLGVIFTDREFLDSYSRVGGLDGAFRFGANHRLRFTAVNADRRADDGERQTGSMMDVNLRREGRHFIYDLRHNEIHPEFGTDLGFVRRVDQKQTEVRASYRWWPEHWIINWEPGLQYERNYNYQGVLQDERIGGRVNFQFANNISFNTNVNRAIERYRNINFRKTRYSLGGNMNTSRRFSVGGYYWTGDQIRFIDEPFLGAEQQLNLFINVRPFSRLQSELTFNTSRFVDVRTDTQEFDIKILRTRTTYQFTNRLLLRNIVEYDTFEKTLGGNVLVSYRVNAGTVFFVGYDDHYQRGDAIHDHDDHGDVIHGAVFPTTAMIRTNRAVFTKLQYLFRY